MTSLQIATMGLISNSFASVNIYESITLELSMCEHDIVLDQGIIVDIENSEISVTIQDEDYEIEVC